MLRIYLGTTIQDIVEDIGYGEIREFFKAEMDDEINEAYNDGLKEGYDDGYESGEQVGFDNGYKKAKEELSADKK